jgi:O-acetyl-ADP-ribose deacetylase (regulator of RNase III)
VVDALEQAFANAPEVLAPHGDIFEHMADVTVSPANSFGYMDGGIDLVYSNYFGWELEANSKTLLSNGITANCRLDRP